MHLAVCPDHDDSELPECLVQPADRSSEAGGVVLGALQQAVAGCWRRGWQPAGLVRLATDAIAAEMRAYASATVDSQWSAQLAELAAAAWWERDDEFLLRWSARHRVSLVEVVGCAVEVLAGFSQLPHLPKLMPIPGTARPAATAHPDQPVDERMLDRVRALLAKAESTTFPEEAETYTAKAQQLMARHSIDHALLTAGAPAPETPGGRRLGVDNPYEQPKALLLDKVATANRCRSVWHKEFGFSTVMGFPADLDAVELLYTSLLVQATAAMLHEGSRRDRAGRSRTRDHEVDEAMDRTFPGLVSTAVRATDREGWASGTAAADRASLSVRGRVEA